MNDNSRISPFKFAFQNSFAHIKIKISEKYEDIEDYAAQDHKILNTMQATANLWFRPFFLRK